MALEERLRFREALEDIVEKRYNTALDRINRLQKDYPYYLDPCCGINNVLALSCKKKDMEKELKGAEPLAVEEAVYSNLTPYGSYLAARCFMALGIKSQPFFSYMGNLFLKKKQKMTKPLEYALLCYERALAKEPSMLCSNFDMAMAHDTALNDRHKAVEWYKKSLSVLDEKGCPEDEFRNPGLIRFLCNNKLAQIFNEFKDFDTSLRYYKEAQEIRSTPASKSAIAGTYLALGKKSEGLHMAGDAIAETMKDDSPSFSDTLIKSGIAENLVPSQWFISPVWMFMPSKRYLDGGSY
jgi:tetratricopeptide (TPR) repeat protein